VGLPTHFTPAVAMSAMAIGVGILLSPFYDRLRDGVRWLSRGPATATWWYDTGLRGFERASALATPRVQTGTFRTAATWVLGTTVVLALAGYVAAGVSLPAVSGIEITTPIVVILVVAVLGAGAVARAPSHVAGVL